MLQQDLSYYRGDSKILSINIAENLTGRDLTFVVKADKNPLSDRLIEKDTDDGITILYSSPYTTVSMTIDKLDLADLEAKVYYYDIISVDPEDAEDSVTVAGGNFILIGDVQTPYDGTGSLPANATRVMVVSEVGNATELYPVWNNTDKVVEFKTLEDFSIATKGYYKEYWVHLNQSGENNPTVVNVINNTLGNVVATREEMGFYVLTLEGAFTENKTIFPNNFSTFVLGKSGIDGVIYFRAMDTINQVSITTHNSDYNFSDGILNHTIRIIVLE
jgi:hypothetical protein